MKLINDILEFLSYVHAPGAKVKINKSKSIYNVTTTAFGQIVSVSTEHQLIYMLSHAYENEYRSSDYLYFDAKKQNILVHTLNSKNDFTEIDLNTDISTEENLFQMQLIHSDLEIEALQIYQSLVQANLQKSFYIKISQIDPFLRVMRNSYGKIN